MRPSTAIMARLVAAILLVGMGLAPRHGADRASAAGPRGGTLVATTGTDLKDLDPAISYSWADYNMLHEVFNGLLGYKPGTVDLVPDIATSFPDVSKDGLVWTFTLRKGVMFHPPVSREVVAADFKYSWQRVLDPKTASPGVTFFLSIAGAKEFNAGKARDVSGIQVLGPYTLRVRLIKPYAPFKLVMAMPFSFVVPHETVERYPKDFSHHAVGTGPFMLGAWIQDQQTVFNRNPHYFHAGLPYLDQVVLKVVNETSVALLQVQRGQADMISDGMTGADYLRLKSDPAWGKQIVANSTLSLIYLHMDTGNPPLDDRTVRQAIAMAIDKKRLLQVGAGPLGAIAGGIYPPGVPCFNPNLRTWPYDPARARALLAKAGSHGQLSLTILAHGTSAAQDQTELVIQRDLARVGIDARLKMAESSLFTSAEGTPNAKHLAVTVWNMDFADPSDFIDPLLTSTAAQQGGSNYSFYRNATVDRLAAQADSTIDQDRRCGLYRTIEQTVIDDAAWVPLYVPRNAYLVAPRVRNFDVSPNYNPFDFDQYQVTR